MVAENFNKEINLGNVSFKDDGETVTGAQHLSGTQDSTFMEPTSPDITQTLERPVLVGVYTIPLNSHQTMLQELDDPDQYGDVFSIFPPSNLNTNAKVGIPFPHAIIKNSPPARSKLNYHTYFKAGVKLRFTVNNLPTTAGKIWFFVDYFPTLTGSRSVVAENLIGYNITATRATGCPGVELDLSNAHTVELEIPYTSPLASYDLTEAEDPQFNVYCRPLTKLRTNGSGTVEINVYASFTNPQLSMPTPVTLDPAYSGETSNRVTVGRVYTVEAEYEDLKIDNRFIVTKIDTDTTDTGCEIAYVNSAGHYITKFLDFGVLRTIAPTTHLFNANTGLSDTYTPHSGLYNWLFPTKESFDIWKPESATPICIQGLVQGKVKITNSIGQAEVRRVQREVKDYILLQGLPVYAVVNDFTDVHSITDKSGQLSIAVSQANQEREIELDGYTPHSGVDTEQEEKSNKGVISGIAGTVAKVGGVLSHIPLLGKIAKPVTWAAKIVQKVSSAFGFSTPLSLEAPKPYFTHQAKGYTQVENLDAGVRLGPTQDGGVVSGDDFGSGTDEMELYGVVSNVQMVDLVDWRDIYTRGHIIAAIPVTPTYCGMEATASRPTIHVTNCGYAASMFTHWRGTINYRISLAKTVYHSGRLRVTYIPGSGKQAPTVSDMAVAANFPTAYTKIYDLKDTGDINFEIPYVNRQPVLPIKFWLPGNTYSHDWTSGCNGYLVITVDNPLKHSGNVAASVDITVWQSGGTDLQFYYPKSDSFVPLTPNVVDQAVSPDGPSPAIGNPSLITLNADSVLSDYAPHSGVYTSEESTDHVMEHGEANAETFISETSNSSSSPETGKQIFGETIINLRQLTRKFTRSKQVEIKSGGGMVGAPVLIDPSCLNVVGDIDINNGASVSPISNSYTDDAVFQRSKVTNMDFTEYLSHLYRFQKGARRYKGFITHGQGLVKVSVSPNPVHSPVGTRSDGHNYSVKWTKHHYQGGFENLVSSDFTLANEVEVPYTRTLPISLITNDRHVAKNSKMMMRLQAQGGAQGDVITMDLYSAAGDNFNMGHIMGAPPIGLPGNALYGYFTPPS